MMKLGETEFFRQMVSVVVGVVLLVMSCAFISIPAAVTATPGALVAAPAPRHLT